MQEQQRLHKFPSFHATPETNIVLFFSANQIELGKIGYMTSHFCVIGCMTSKFRDFAERHYNFVPFFSVGC